MLDLFRAALAAAQSLLGERAPAVIWVQANVLEADLLSRVFSVWRDRAVVHFLTTEEERRAYVKQMRRAVKQGG